jgi:hypothetical protein
VRFEALQVFVGRPGRRGLFPRSHNNQLLIWENTNSAKGRWPLKMAISKTRHRFTSCRKTNGKDKR